MAAPAAFDGTLLCPTVAPTKQGKGFSSLRSSVQWAHPTRSAWPCGYSTSRGDVRAIAGSLGLGTVYSQGKYL